MGNKSYIEDLDKLITRISDEMRFYEDLKRVQAGKMGDQFHYGFTCGMLVLSEEILRELRLIRQKIPKPLDQNLDKILD